VRYKLPQQIGKANSKISEISTGSKELQVNRLQFRESTVVDWMEKVSDERYQRRSRSDRDQ